MKSGPISLWLLAAILFPRGAFADECSSKCSELQRAAERLIARHRPVILAIEQGRPGTKSAPEPQLVRALLETARTNGIPTVRVSRRATAVRMSGATQWAGQLKALRSTYAFLTDEIPENPRWTFRISETFRTLRPKYTALSIAHVLVQDGILPRATA